LNGSPTVFLVSANRQVARGLREIFEGAGLGFQAHASPNGFLEAAHRNGGGCLILDLRTPWVADPADDPPRPALHRVGLPVVLLTGAEKLSARSRADADEAAGCARGAEALLETVREALAEDARAREERERGAEVSSRMVALTRREREVMAMVVDGLSNRRIAAHFGISARTVEIHRARVMEKMGADSLSELVRMACLKGVELEPPEARPARKT
jgi:FixJ family two-component response regulator